MDSIDVAAAEFRLRDDTVELLALGYFDVPYPGGLRNRLLNAMPPAERDAGEFCQLDTAIGRCFADAAAQAIDVVGQADLVASLGQTLYHWARDGQTNGTLQLGQPAWIAERTGLPVLTDFRTRDVAAGGNGAPLVGVLDALWLVGEADTKPRAALNIGGIANITLVGTAEPIAYDTGPGNALIDAAANMASGGQWRQDTNGAAAASGTVHLRLLETLLADSYFRAEPPKSTGKERFNVDYVHQALGQIAANGDMPSDADLLATCTELTAVTIADSCRAHQVRTVVASGGGTSNPTLMNRIRQLLGPEITLITSDELGLPTHGKEAYLAALLGFLSWNGLSGTLPSATGARGPRVLGSITPGRDPLIMPEPAAHQARRLRLTTPETHYSREPLCEDSIS